MKIIFLDIDGVLNCQEAYRNGFCEYVNLDENHSYQKFYPPSKELLNKLIDETKAKIVISSTWRKSGLEYMKKVWENEKMSGEIIGLTPSFYHKDLGSIPRGSEINHWLEEQKLRQIFWSEDRQQEYIDNSGIENFIIIDDDGDMLYSQRKHFVHVLPAPRNFNGFNTEYYEQALNILNKSIIELNY